MNETSPLPARLVTCVDVAAARVKELPTATFADRIRKSMAYQVELVKAKEEMERGEWSQS